MALDEPFPLLLFKFRNESLFLANGFLLVINKRNCGIRCFMAPGVTRIRLSDSFVLITCFPFANYGTFSPMIWRVMSIRLSSCGSVLYTEIIAFRGHPEDFWGITRQTFLSAQRCIILKFIHVRPL